MTIQFVQGTPFFTSINLPTTQYPYLNEDITTDVLVIGGGVTGSIIGYYFSKQGIQTTLIDKSHIAHCSTSITTSLLQYELDSNARELQQYTPLDRVLKSYDLGLTALKELNQFINAHGNHCLYKVRDCLLYTSKQGELTELEEEFKSRKNHGLDVSFLDETQNKYPFSIKAGIYAHEGGAELDPFLYTHQLLHVAAANGLKIFENTYAKEISFNSYGADVLTSSNHQIKAKTVIIATGYNSEQFTNLNFGDKTTSFNIVTSPLPPDKLWFNQTLIRDNKPNYNYLRTTDDHRIIIGGEDVDCLPDNLTQEIADEKYLILESKLKSMFPHLEKHIDIQYKYCGTFDSTPDNLGFLGPDPNQHNLWYALGYGANGILFAILGGMMLSKLYLGQKDPNLDLFKVDRFSLKK